MTPAELRSLADEATSRIGDGDLPSWRVADAILIALAPDLARLCAELGEAAQEPASILIAEGFPVPAVEMDWQPQYPALVAALAKLSELETP